MREHELQNRIRVALSKILGATFWRNNTGRAWMGNRVVKNKDGSITIHDPRPVEFGLHKGSSDLIGFLQVTITPDMVGKVIAQFTSIEVKTENGKVTKHQQRFTDHVNKNGGRGIIARSVEDVRILETVDK